MQYHPHHFVKYLYLYSYDCICFSHITFFSHYFETDLFLSWHSLDEDFGFSPWSSWNPCGKTCTNAVSPAIKSRQRKCITPPCSGSSHQEKACNLPQCSGVNVEISWSASCYMYLFGSVQLVFASTAFCCLNTTKIKQLLGPVLSKKMVLIALRMKRFVWTVEFRK